MKIALLGAVVLSLLASPAVTDGVGLFGLYRAGDDGADAAAPRQLEAGLGGRGCAVRREGGVTGARGDLELPDANRFMLLQCDEPLLGGTSRRAALLALSETIDGLVWIEGELTESAGLTAPADPDRVYLIKLSRYNEHTPDARDREVAEPRRCEGLPQGQRRSLEAHRCFQQGPPHQLRLSGCVRRALIECSSHSTYPSDSSASRSDSESAGTSCASAG